MRRPAFAPPSRYALLSLSEVSVDSTAFDQRAPRAGGAAGTAIAAHAIVLLIASGLARLQPLAPAASPQAVASAIEPFVFTRSANQGSGRTGGGDHSLGPVALLRTVGDHLRAVAASAPRSLSTPDTIAPERDTAPALPVAPMDAGLLARVGALDGVPGPPSDARGPGDSGVGTRTGPNRGLGDGPGSSVGDGPYLVGNGVAAPDLLHRTPPQYSAEAMRAKLQGVAVLSGIVGVDGVLHDIRVVRSLDAAFGLDGEAIACVRQWRFRPGMRAGKPVAVYVRIEVAFNLR
jgi:TonB family protein